ncbi:putative Fe-S oxidoreductase [Thermanaerovibrio velox DSM 12556]|uniref:Putative Fe-S oxidoreductase n=1 Tax=Thermanaerovibrio velox DSM 12556 TaxID=926567 RepID=H0US78_9BACT|nr:TIGR01212 family radical SAM protein [Thermanaerovibrio velox]EHM10167.1 putative Fe-S oxidoreductase [Thermanaerovibrio velox DSM 12556]
MNKREQELSRDVPWNSFSASLRSRHGERVWKICIDGGFGCPHRTSLTSGGCVFCDPQGGGDGSFLQGIGIEEQCRIKSSKLLARGISKTILYFQSYSCTNVSMVRLSDTVARALATAERSGIQVVGLAFGVRPDQLPDAFASMLKDWAASGLEVWAEVGVQVLDDSMLKWLNRGHDSQSAIRAIETLSKLDGVMSCAHLIGGIPEEAPLRMAMDAERICMAGALGIKFHPLHILRNTELHKRFSAGLFSPPSMEYYMESLVEALRRTPPHVEVQRLTADASPEQLISPSWLLRKGDFIRDLEARMRSSGARQGDLWRGNSSKSSQ